MYKWESIKKAINQSALPKTICICFPSSSFGAMMFTIITIQVNSPKRLALGPMSYARPHLGTIRRIYKARKTVCNRLNNSARQVSFTKEIHVMVTGASQDMISFNILFLISLDLFFLLARLFSTNPWLVLQWSCSFLQGNAWLRTF